MRKTSVILVFLQILAGNVLGGIIFQLLGFMFRELTVNIYSFLHILGHKLKLWKASPESIHLLKRSWTYKKYGQTE